MRANAIRPYRIGGLLVLLLFALAFPVLFANPTVTSMAIFTMMFAGMATGWNILAGYGGYISFKDHFEHPGVQLVCAYSYGEVHEARASWSGGFARPAARTLRLPALHRGTQYEGRRSPAAPFRVMSTEQAHRGY